jgi:hypothetical protein
MNGDHWLQVTELILQYAVAPMLGLVAYYMRGMAHEMRQMNGRLLKLEEWRSYHDKQDDERHDRLEQYIHDVDLRGRRQPL